MNGKRIAAALAVALGLGGLAAPAGAQTELMVWHAYRGGERDAFEKVVASYNAARKGKVEVQTLA